MKHSWFGLGLSVAVVVGCKSEPRYRVTNELLINRFDAVYSIGSGAMRQWKGTPAELLKIPVALILGAAAKAGVSAELENGLLRITVAAKNFQAPRGLGLGRGDFCYVVVGKERMNDRVIAGIGRISLRDRESGDTLRFYAQRTDSDRFLACNSRELLESTLDAARKPTMPAARTDTTLDLQAEVWAIRKFDRDVVAEAGATDLKQDLPIEHLIRRVTFSVNRQRGRLQFAPLGERVRLIKLLGALGIDSWQSDSEVWTEWDIGGSSPESIAAIMSILGHSIYL